MRPRPNPAPPAARRFLLLAAFLALATPAAAKGWFAYTDQFRVVTLEFTGENLAILNVINLGDTSFVVEPSSVLMLKSDAQVVAGQVFASKEPSGAVLYRASLVVPSRTATGTDLTGAFHLRGDALKVYVLLAGRYLELATLRRDQFESLLGRLSELDLAEPDVDRMFKSLAIPDVGVFIPYEEADSIRALHEKCFTEEGVHPPKVLRRPAPVLTDEARKAGYAALVTASIRLDRAGNIVGVALSPEPTHGMSERVKATILNSWQFLPATLSGEVMATELKVLVQIGDTGGSGKTENR